MRPTRVDAVAGNGDGAVLQREAPQTGRTMRARTNIAAALNFGVGTRFLAARTQRVFAGFVLVVAFAQLLLDFFGDKIDGRIQIGLAILGKDVRPRHRQPDGAGKLAFRALSGGYAPA